MPPPALAIPPTARPLPWPCPPGALLHQIHRLCRAEVLDCDVLTHTAHAVPQEVIPVAVGNLAIHVDHLHHKVVHCELQGGWWADLVGQGHLLQGEGGSVGMGLWVGVADNFCASQQAPPPPGRQPTCCTPSPQCCGPLMEWPTGGEGEGEGEGKGEEKTKEDGQ